MGKRKVLLVALLVAAIGGARSAGVAQAQNGTQIPGEVLFSDDFSSQTSGWSLDPESQGSASVEEGRLHLTNYPDNERAALSYVEGQGQFDDFVLEVETEFIAGGEGKSVVGVLFRGDRENGYHLMITADGSYQIGKGVEGEATVLAGPARSTHIATGLGATNIIRVECIGDSLRLSVNGQQLAEVTDDSFVAGDIGFTVVCLGGADRTEVAFDNLVIYDQSP